MAITATTVNLQEVADYLASIPASAFDDFKEETARALFEADTNIKTKTALEKRTGNLMKSMKVTSTGSNFSNYKASIYTNSIYARVHEEGATGSNKITAKKAYMGVPGGPYLNIPTDANKTASGVTRLQAREVFARGGYIAEFGSLRYGVMLDGQLMFSLKKSVEIPARLNMVSSVEDVVPTLLSRLAARIGD